MLIVMDRTATREQVDRVIERVRQMGFTPHPMPGAQRTAIGITGNAATIPADQLEELPGVLRVIEVTQPFKLVSREFHPEDSVVPVGPVSVGGAGLAIMAGPCSVESEDQTMRTAEAVRRFGGQIFRAGAFKPRTSPYSFQGLREEGLRILEKVRRSTGLPIVTEAMDIDTVDAVAEVADLVQIGARNMQNFSLLRRVGRCRKPVLLKRGMSATVEEWLMAAEYIFSEGNHQVILCERGIRTFCDHTRNTLDLAAVPAAKRLSHLPVIVDPSHGTGKRSKVIPLARAAVAVGADGLMVEVHPDPDRALSDGAQSLTFEMLEDLLGQVGRLAPIVDRRFP
jgi:3-deoxy-7-phosphoheptulonate synthase